MSVLGRIADILQAKTNKVLDRLEDPNETLDLSYEKMIAGLQETKLHLADVVAQQKSLEHQITTAEAEAAKAEDDARLALQANREDLARAALAHKHAALEKSQALRSAHEAVVPQAQKLADYQKRLEERIESFRLQKEVMKTGYTAAAAQAKVAQSMAGIGDSFNNVGDTLRRAQDKVDGMRAKAEAMESLTESGVLADPLDGKRKEERDLDALRAGGAIDSDLAKLKAELAAGAKANPGG